jgi:hypothetical protein
MGFSLLEVETTDLELRNGNKVSETWKQGKKTYVNYEQHCVTEQSIFIIKFVGLFFSDCFPQTYERWFYHLTNLDYQCNWMKCLINSHNKRFLTNIFGEQQYCQKWDSEKMSKIDEVKENFAERIYL